MKALAHYYVWNEIDMLSWSVRHILDQGVDVWIDDNWSDDGSWEEAQALALAYPGRIFLERWPAGGEPPAGHRILDNACRIEEWGVQVYRLGYEWVLEYNVDELRCSAVPGESLVEALARFNRHGWNAVDHVYVSFLPREGWPCREVHPEAWFTERVQTDENYDLPHVRCWRQPAERVSFRNPLMHGVQFPGMSLALEKLILKHYPLRTREQTRKRLEGRRQRMQLDRGEGWRQYVDGELGNYARSVVENWK